MNFSFNLKLFYEHMIKNLDIYLTDKFSDENFIHPYSSLYLHCIKKFYLMDIVEIL